MAIDFNKPLGAPAAASAALPTKTSMNLLVHESKTQGAWKYVLAALALALLVGLFAKFAVLDVFKQVDLKRSELSAVQAELATVQGHVSSYDAVLEEYRSYTGTANEGAIDALSVMDMVATVIQPKATVTGAATSDGTLVVNVKGITLDELGKIADTVRAEAMVENVVVSNATEVVPSQEKGTSGQSNSSSDAAADTSAKTVSASLEITLVNPQAEGGEQ